MALLRSNGVTNFRQYPKCDLIERYGGDIRLPDLREEIALCERRGLMHDACMVRYVELVVIFASSR